MSDCQAYPQHRWLLRADVNPLAAGIAKAFAASIMIFSMAAMAPSASLLGQEIELETPIVPVAQELAPIAVEDMSMSDGYTVACDSCGGGGCTSCSGGSGIGFWFRADYMMWWEKETYLPPLSTSATGAAPIIGDPGTVVRFGDDFLNDNPLDGYRFELGAWLDPGYNLGLFGRYFSSGDRDIQFAAGANDFEVLGIPFFNPATGLEDALLLTFPGEREGSQNIRYDGEIDGWELLLRRIATTGCNYRVDYLIGYRHLSVDEGLTMNATTTVLPGSPNGIEGQTVSLRDSIRTENKFNGVDIGLTGQSTEGCWTLDFLAKIALGQMDRQIDIQGNTLIVTPGLPDETLVGGVFSQESNIGTTKADDFAVIPEFNLNIGYAMTPSLDFTFGYTVIYMTDVVHPGNAMDRIVDPGLLSDSPPVASNNPAVRQDKREYWIQGLNFGLTGRF